MSPSVSINLPETEFEDCERRLRDGNLLPYTSTRETTEYFHLDIPPTVTVHGTITVGGERFQFDWHSGRPGSSLDVLFMEHSKESQLALLDALNRVFPEPEPPRVQHPPLRKSLADRSGEFGCGLLLLLFLALLVFGIYGFITFFRQF